jgi:hypothetical protein
MRILAPEDDRYWLHTVMVARAPAPKPQARTATFGPPLPRREVR